MVFRKIDNHVELTHCPKCNGAGEVKQTHFDQITATPEALAKFLIDVRNNCWTCGDYGQPECPFGECVDKSSDVLAWLRQEAED